MAMPDWVIPMAATLTDQRFAGPEWIFERKFDGIRLLAYKRDGEVRLYSRTRHRQQMPRVAGAVAALPVPEIILDGEVTWDGEPAYHVFDVLWLDGRDLTGVPLHERQRHLQSLPLQPPLQRVESLGGVEPWRQACTEGWEGVIAKRRDSLYEQRRSKHWLKMKCELTAEFLVGGFTDPLGSRVGLGALLVGFRQDDGLVFAGKVGTGFDTALLRELRVRLDAIEIPAPPFTKAVGLPRLRAHWVRPELSVRVAFLEWTKFTRLRHSRLLAVLP